MRNAAARKKRSVAYRIISILFILMGIANAAMAISGHKAGSAEVIYLLQTELAFVWFVAAGLFVALSRIWGELAEEAAAKE